MARKYVSERSISCGGAAMAVRNGRPAIDAHENAARAKEKSDSHVA